MKDRTTEPIGIIMLRYRQEHDLRQSDLAVRMGVSTATVSRLEDRVTFDTVLDPQGVASVEAFARVYGRPPRFFYEIRQIEIKQQADGAIREAILEPEDFAAYLDVQRRLRNRGA